VYHDHWVGRDGPRRAGRAALAARHWPRRTADQAQGPMVVVDVKPVSASRCGFGR
jgi:hypothetical protein